MSTVTVVPTVEPSTGPEDPPRVRLDVTDTGSPAVTSTVVTRLDPDGRAVPVRTTDGGPLSLAGGPALLYDYGSPFGAPVRYSTLESPATVSSEVTVDELNVWLIHPGVPALSRPILAAGITGRTRRVQRGIHYPLGGLYPVVQTDGQRKAPEYTLTIRTTTATDREAIDTLLEDAGVLLLNVPAGLQWGITAEYVSAGDTVEDRLYAYGPEQRRTWQLPLLVVDRPEGGTQAERTLADLVEYPTLADLAAAYPTLLQLAAGP